MGIRGRVILAAAAVLLALSGCVPAAQQAPDAVVNELSGILQAAIEDRNATVRAEPPVKQLDDGESTAAFKETRAREVLELTARGKRLKASGFWYVGSSSNLTVQSATLSADGREARVSFEELTELSLASAAGPSDVPTKYSMPQTARFIATDNGWQLDGLGFDTSSKGILPPTIVAPR